MAFLSQYVPILKDHFENSPRNINATYVSNTIENELIAALYHNMIEKLKKELQTCTYFSIMMDEATSSDSGRKEILVNIYRPYTDSTDAETLFQILLIGIAKVGLTSD